MPGFADSFWSADYAGGLGILFQKLQQGIAENQQVLTIASMRADAEQNYSESLAQIAPTVDRVTGGFKKDEGASVKKAYEGVRSEMVEASKNHQKIANNIRELVVIPFSRWCDAHALRIQSSQEDLQAKIKTHDRQAEVVKKLRSTYFNKCRLVEDLEEENKLAFPDPEKEQSTPKPQSPTPKIVLPEEEPEELPVEIGDETYTPEQVKSMLTHMLETIPLRETKVPILGTYQNTSAGTDIVDYIQKHMKAGSVAYAEKIGQDLVNRGFLRLVGNVGSVFANSSKMKYQWKPRVWQITGIPERKKIPTRTGTAPSLDDLPDSPIIGNISETLSSWNLLNNPYPNEKPADKLKREAREADEKYKTGVQRLDLLRCNLEESIMDYLKYLEKCELDRLKAIRSVILDFSGAISNSIPSFQSQVDNMMLYQETIQPLGDLRYLLENYRTGAFVPKVIPYENYYGRVDEQTFGVDLESRARADKKRVPIIVTAILSFLDSHYPDLEGDEARRSIWLLDVPLADTHRLRNAINNGAPVPRELLEQHPIPVVASVLKLYLLELPDSLVSSQIYEVIKTIYSATSDATPNPISIDSLDAEPRIKVLQSTLGQLRLNNIATLDAVTTHFTRLIDLTSADEAYVTNLAQVLAPCILRPKAENPLTMNERYAYRLIRDLFDYKDSIFGELKRQSSTLAPLSGGPGSLSNSSRVRAVSTADESSRRANMEARQKAISERTREKSPAPGNRHRRDKSTEGSQGRFPVVASPRADGMFTSRNVSGVGVAQRQSLEVPGNSDSNFGVDPTPSSTRIAPSSNGYNTAISMPMPGELSGFGPSPHIPPPLEDDSPVPDESYLARTTTPTSATEERNVGKQNSLKRRELGSGSRTRRGGGTLRGLPSFEGGSPSEGVTLTDKPMNF